MNMTLRIYSFTLFAHKLQDRHNIQTDDEVEEEEKKRMMMMMMKRKKGELIENFKVLMMMMWCWPTHEFFT